jgi:hypothetical protein
MIDAVGEMRIGGLSRCGRHSPSEASQKGEYVIHSTSKHRRGAMGTSATLAVICGGALLISALPGGATDGSARDGGGSTRSLFAGSAK